MYVCINSCVVICSCTSFVHFFGLQADYSKTNNTVLSNISSTILLSEYWFLFAMQNVFHSTWRHTCTYIYIQLQKLEICTSFNSVHLLMLKYQVSALPESQTTLGPDAEAVFESARVLLASFVSAEADVGFLNVSRDITKMSPVKVWFAYGSTIQRGFQWTLVFSIKYI